ncbi:MAG: hypothetical protein GY833_16575 [Aestuariibacter sp.]|nr:hypothetical protein [Aestuariibacter sp.]
MNKGQHGEPWRICKEDDHILDANGDYVYEGAYSYDVLFPHKDRATACVNALDGMEPDALQGLIDAASWFAKTSYDILEDGKRCTGCLGIDSHSAICPVLMLKTALSALTGGE